VPGSGPGTASERRTGASVAIEAAALGEPPAGGAVRLGGAYADHRAEGVPEEMPRRRPSTRRAVGRGECVAGYLGRPAYVAVDTGDRSKIAGSVTRTAAPSRVSSIPGSLTEIVQAGFDARFRILRVPGPLGK
jgi:hypothetical protein